MPSLYSKYEEIEETAEEEKRTETKEREESQKGSQEEIVCWSHIVSYI